MKTQDRKEKSIFHNELTKLLTDNVKDDDEFFKRLIWANEIIANEISRFL
jgi:hypothetical protein